MSARACTCETLCSYLHKIGRVGATTILPCHLLCHTRYTTVWWGEGERKGEGHLEQLRDVQSSTTHRNPHVLTYAQSHTAESMRLPSTARAICGFSPLVLVTCSGPLNTHTHTPLW